MLTTPINPNTLRTLFEGFFHAQSNGFCVNFNQKRWAIMHANYTQISTKKVKRDVINQGYLTKTPY